MFITLFELWLDSVDTFLCNTNINGRNLNNIKEFGIDGYSLWLFVQSLEQNINGNLYRLKMLKSSSLNNCSMVNQVTSYIYMICVI